MKNSFLKVISIVAAAIILSITLTISIAAAYPRHTDFVSDKAVIIDEKTESKIIEASKKLFKERGVRIAVCTVLDTDGETIEHFGSELFKEWEIGDGVLILLSINDDNFYAVQSNSLSEYLSAKELKHILNMSLEPAFAAKDYSKGVGETVNALSNHLSGSVPQDFGKDESKGLPTWAVVLIVIVVVIAVIIGAGAALIIFLRKKNARRRREEMELRRRRLAEGRGVTPRQSPRRPAQGNASRPSQAPGNMTGANGVPIQGMNMRPATGASGRPMQGNLQRPTQNANQQSDPTAYPQRQPSRDRHPNNAATIQINTSDIRAAKQNKRQ